MNMRDMQRLEIDEAWRRLDGGERSGDIAKFARKAMGFRRGELATILGIPECSVFDCEQSGLTVRIAAAMTLMLRMVRDGSRPV